MKTQFAAALAALIALALVPSTVEACSVPVFRFALERWQAEPYEVVVLHAGKLGAGHAKLVAWLRECSEGFEARTNMEVFVIDVDGEVDNDFAELVNTADRTMLPSLILRYPRRYGAPTPLWEEPLTPQNAQRLIDSPARRKIGMNLLKGDAAVWVLLTSGDREKDEAAGKLLRTEIDKLAKTLQLPEILPEDVLEEAEAIPKLEITFSMVTVDRADAKESALVSMIFGMEAEIEVGKEPAVFAVIGQGRALPALAGAGINAVNIRAVAEFCAGPCSCIVKDQNPGVDLLTSVDWEALPDGKWVKPQPLPDLTDVGMFVGKTEAPSAQPDDTPAAEAPPDGVAADTGVFPITLVAVLGLAVLGVLIATFILTRHRREA